MTFFEFWMKFNEDLKIYENMSFSLFWHKKFTFAPICLINQWKPILCKPILTLKLNRMGKICIFKHILSKMAIFRKKYIIRKKNSPGHSWDFWILQIQKLSNHSICEKSFCSFGSKRLKIKSVEFFLRRNPDFLIFKDFASEL